MKWLRTCRKEKTESGRKKRAWRKEKLRILGNAKKTELNFFVFVFCFCFCFCFGVSGVALRRWESCGCRKKLLADLTEKFFFQVFVLICRPSSIKHRKVAIKQRWWRRWSVNKQPTFKFNIYSKTKFLILTLKILKLNWINSNILTRLGVSILARLKTETEGLSRSG